MNDKSARIELAEDICNLGISLVEADKPSEAVLLFRKALLIEPDCFDAVLCLGHCLHLQEKYAAALEVYDRLLASHPEMPEAWNNRGTTLLAICRYNEAVLSYRNALEIMPQWHDTQVALATCYQAIGETAGAKVLCENVLAVAPEHAEAHWNHALLLLLKGDYQQGWQEYEWRWQKRNFTSPLRNFTQPLWQGESIAGKTILIHAEQGFGDTLQFSRFIPLVTDLGARVIFECHPPLAALMESLAGDICVVRMGEQLPSFDLHIPLMSLAGIFNATCDQIPGIIPCVKPSTDRISYWQNLMLKDTCSPSSIRDNSDSLKVGLCWAGKKYPDPLRSCPESELAPLAEVYGISWYSLQADWDKPLPFQITDLTGAIRDFSDTAALISQLDVVITIDTAVAHLAGALGKPTWVLLPYAPDWRWMTEREDSPWYPSMQLFRQKQAGIWGDPVKRVAETLTIKTMNLC